MSEMPRKVVPPPLELVKSRIEEVLPPDARPQMSAGEAVIVDTREPEKFETGHIEGAINLPVGENGADSHSAEFAQAYADAVGDKPALLYCNSGNRSARAADALTNEHGVEGVRSLIGGITLWSDLEMPIEGTIVSDDEDDNEDGAEEGEG